MPHWFCSSCALKRERSFRYFSCFSRRSTVTTTVLSILLLRTTPCRTFGLPRIVLSALLFLATDRLDPRNVAPHLHELVGLLELRRAVAQAQPEELFLQLPLL